MLQAPQAARSPKPAVVASTLGPRRSHRVPAAAVTPDAGAAGAGLAGRGGSCGRSGGICGPVFAPVKEGCGEGISLQKPVKGKRAHKKSRYHGVYFKLGAKPWSAKMKVDGREQWLGSYQIEEDAARAYDQALADDLKRNSNR